nr:MAG TPA: hypothetical protein [Caudoviricetes sp.]
MQSSKASLNKEFFTIGVTCIFVIQFVEVASK